MTAPESGGGGGGYGAPTDPGYEAPEEEDTGGYDAPESGYGAPETGYGAPYQDDSPSYNAPNG